MNTRKLLASAFGGILAAGCLAGFNAGAASKGESPQTEDTAAPSVAVFAESGGESGDVSYEERFKPYEPFGLTYDSGKRELQYKGKTVRWFEDYYTIGDGIQVGNDFFDEKGVVDVYAVRDRSSFVRFADGSFDPSGKLVDVKEFSEKEFAARNIEAIKNPPPAVAIAGDPLSQKELEEMAREYEAFGVTYDIKNDQWYFNGEKVRFFRDVLISNGESLTGGKFKGAMRTMGCGDGTVDIYTVRDYARLDAAGNGTLTGIEKCSREEFDRNTQKEEQASSGFCVVTEYLV